MFQALEYGVFGSIKIIKIFKIKEKWDEKRKLKMRQQIKNEYEYGLKLASKSSRYFIKPCDFNNFDQIYPYIASEFSYESVNLRSFLRV